MAGATNILRAYVEATHQTKFVHGTISKAEPAGRNCDFDLMWKVAVIPPRHAIATASIRDKSSLLPGWFARFETGHMRHSIIFRPKSLSAIG